MASYPRRDRSPLPAIFSRGSLTATTGALQVQEGRAGDADRAGGGASNEGVGYLGAGGKLRSSRPALGKKKPYDRPASSGRHAALPSIPSRFVDSASRLVSSSASYLFSSFFNGRLTPAIGNGVRHKVGAGVAEEEHEGTFLAPPAAKNFQDTQDASPYQGPVLDVSCAGTERNLDLAQVEGILKQQLWSRDQVNRLTEVLQTRVRESNAVSPNAESQIRLEQIKKGQVEFNPVQVAKAYMGEHTLRTSRAASSFRSTSYPYDGVAGPSSGSGLLEDTHRSSPGLTTRTRIPASATARMHKRRFIADDDDIVSRGAIRRVRQKMTLVTNTSPYIRQVTAAIGPLRTSTPPLLQSTQTADKKMEILEKPTLSSKGKSKEEPEVATGKCHNEQAPESSKVRETLETLEVREKEVLLIKESPLLPTFIEPGLSSGKPAFEAAAPAESEAIRKSALGSSTPIPGSPIIIPERTKGFRMSAVFEESDDESELQVQAPTSREAQQPAILSISKEVPASATIKSFSSLMPNDVLCSTATEFVVSTTNSLPLSFQSSVSAALSTAETSRLPAAPSPLTCLSDTMSSTVTSTFTHVENSISPLPTMRPFPALSFPPTVTERGSPVLNVSAATTLSTVATSSVALLTSPVSTSPKASTPLPAAAVAVSSPVSEAASPEAGVSASPPATVSQRPSLAAETAPAEVVALVASGAPPAVTGLAAAPTQPVLVSSAAAVSSAGTASSSAVFAAAPVAVVLPVAMGASLPENSTPGRASPGNATAIDGVFEAENRGTLATESSGADRPAEVDTMATDPMTEEPDTSTMCSSAPAFSFGAASTATSTSSLSFGAGAVSSTPPTFSFAMQSSCPSASSLSASFTFGSQSSTPPAGQLFTFGAPASPSPANPFSSSTTAHLKPAFSFGSSAPTSATPIFTATSSAPPSFPATPAAAPSPLPFNMHATSSPLTSSTLGLGAQMTTTASAFGSTGAANSSPAFTFSASPVLSATPSFPFGAGAGTPMFSGSSFAGQSFTFGAQPTPVAANPFAPSGASNSVPFQFASPATTSAQSTFSFGVNAVSTPSSTFAFGAQPAASPVPFTFGGQSGALTAGGQPFAFGGQPTGPAQNSFSSFATPAQSIFPSSGALGVNVTGGFALGATGGEKSGRKYIKAKRTGGAKRGK